MSQIEMSHMELRDGIEVEVSEPRPHSLHQLLVGIFGEHDVDRTATNSRFTSLMRRELWSPEMENA